MTGHYKYLGGTHFQACITVLGSFEGATDSTRNVLVLFAVVFRMTQSR